MDNNNAIEFISHRGKSKTIVPLTSVSEAMRIAQYWFFHSSSVEFFGDRSYEIVFGVLAITTVHGIVYYARYLGKGGLHYISKEDVDILEKHFLSS